MSYLTLGYCGSLSSNLYTCYFDGSDWTGNQTIGAQPGSIDPDSTLSPGCCFYNNRMYLAYKSSQTNNIFLCYFDGKEWVGDYAISSLPGGISPQTTGFPTLVAFNGRMYMFYNGAGTNNIYSAYFDGTTWFGNTQIGDQPGNIDIQSSDGVSAAVYQNVLYLAYKGKSSTLYTATFDGTTWAGNTAIGDQSGGISPSSSSSPGMAVYQGNLYLAYCGSSKSDIYTAVYNGSSWSGNTKISSQSGDISPNTNGTPACIAFNNLLYLIYTASNGSLATCTFNGSSWAGNTNISAQNGGISPASNACPQAAVMPTAPGRMLNWLSAISDDTLICDISMPGTHDSAAINRDHDYPATCHNVSLTEQLDNGARVLDIRIKVIKSDDGYTFKTCHGDGPDNEYQPLPEALDAFARFLAQNPTEMIAVSLKIDDWNGNKDDKTNVCASLSALLASYPVFTDNLTDVPPLSQVRGKLYLLNRITSDLQFGVPIDWSDNTSGSWAKDNGDRSFNVYVQDQYEDLPFTGQSAAKLTLFTDALSQKQSGAMLINFASATYFLAGKVSINSGFMGWLGENSASGRPAVLGWSLWNYESNYYQTSAYGFMNVMQLIISANTAYQSCPDVFSVSS